MADESEKKIIAEDEILKKKLIIVPPGLKERYETFKDHYKVAEGAPILILGPTGVGKTLFYQIYENLFLKENPDVGKDKIVLANCAHFGNQNSDPNIARSELFGIDPDFNSILTNNNPPNKKGLKQKADGLIQQANGGVLFLEEIGELPIVVQAMLLTFIEDKKFKRVGAVKEESSDCRIVAATNNEGALREDFKNRFFPFYLPPIYKRRNDVLYYLDAKYPDLVASLSKDEILELLSYNWPGNVREIERVALLILRILIKRERDREIYYEGILREDSLWKFFKTDEIDLGGSDRHKHIILDNQLKKIGADVNFLESLINEYGLSLEVVVDDYHFPFGKLETRRPEFERSELIGDYKIKIYAEYEPFEKAYEGFILFCRLFLQNHLDNKNVKKDLTECCPKRIEPRINLEKKNHSKFNDLSKKIYFFLSGIELDKSDRLPIDYDDLVDFLEQQAKSHPENRFLANMLPDDFNYKHVQSELSDEITSLTQDELLKKYYIKMLELTKGNVAAASRLIRISDSTFRDKLREYGLQKKK